MYLRITGLLLSALLLAPDAFAQSLSFQQALDSAMSDTPTLRADTVRIDAAREAAKPAGALPDPKLALGIDNLPVQGTERYSLDRDFMTMRRVTLMQDIPNSAKREARIAAADGRLEAAEAQAQVTRITVLRETANAWIARNTIEQQLKRLDALDAENKLLDTAVRAQLAGGKGNASDAVMPRQEAAMLAERRDDLVARSTQAIATLKRWIGDAGAEPLTGEAPDWNLSRDLLAHAVHRHPELALLTSQAKVMDAEVAEAKASKHPDWGVDLSYQKRAPEFGDMVSVQLRFDLPIFSGSRQDPEIAAKQAERDALEADQESAFREHIARLDTDWADYQRLVSASQRQHQVMQALADEKVQLVMAAWRGGKASLADVIAARRERIETELKTIAVDGELRQTAARLHYVYGEEK